MKCDEMTLRIFDKDWKCDDDLIKMGKQFDHSHCTFR